MFKQKDHEIGRNKGSKIPCPDTQGFFQTVAQRYIGGFFVIKLSSKVRNKSSKNPQFTPWVTPPLPPVRVGSVSSSPVL